MSLINGITLGEIKKIFSNSLVKRNYLQLLSNFKPKALNLLSFRDFDEAIIETWEYNLSKQILRELFRTSEKYNKNKNSGEKIVALMNEWYDLNLGKLDWPFQPNRFDQYIHSLNRNNLTESEKDDIVASIAIKYRRIKDINAQRNDYIEYLMVENNENVIPTFANRRGVDYYINGEPFDQKVSRSVSKHFITAYGEGYRQVAIQRPDLLAKCLYENQDEARFGYEPRLFVIYLDSDLEIQDIDNSFANIDFDRPINIDFEYRHADGRTIRYTTKCYIILLHR